MKNEVKVAGTTKWTAEQIEILKGELNKAKADLATATAKVAELEKAIAENATEALKNEMKMWQAQVEAAEGLIENYEKDLVEEAPVVDTENVTTAAKNATDTDSLIREYADKLFEQEKNDTAILHLERSLKRSRNAENIKSRKAERHKLIVKRYDLQRAIGKLNKAYQQAVEKNPEVSQKFNALWNAIHLEKAAADHQAYKAEREAQSDDYVVKTYTGVNMGRISERHFKTKKAAFNFLYAKTAKFAGFTYWNVTIEHHDEEIYANAQGNESTNDAEIQDWMDEWAVNFSYSEYKEINKAANDVLLYFKGNVDNDRAKKFIRLVDTANNFGGKLYEYIYPKKAIVEYTPPAIEPDEVLTALEVATAEKLEAETRRENLSEFNTFIEEEMKITDSRLDNSLNASIANPTNENISSYIAFADRRILLEEVWAATDKATIEANDFHIDSVLNIEKARVMSGLKYAVYVENNCTIIKEHTHTIAEAIAFISKQNDLIEWWIDKGVITDEEFEFETIATGEKLDTDIFDSLIDKYDMKFTEGEIVASATSPVNADLTHDDTLTTQTTQSDTNTAKIENMSVFEPIAKPDREKQDSIGNKPDIAQWQIDKATGFNYVPDFCNDEVFDPNAFLAEKYDFVNRQLVELIADTATLHNAINQFKDTAEDNLINQISAYKTANFP